VSVYNLGSSAQEAVKVLRTFTDGEPDLIKTGIPGVDRIIGGIFPGVAGIIGADTGVGKSSTMLGAAMTAASAASPVGIVSLEDSHDVLGTRAISLVSGVDSLKIRRKDLTLTEKNRIYDAMETLGGLPVHVVYCIGGKVHAVLDALDELHAKGCRLVYIDYLQKMRGGGQDRRNEVASNFTVIQARAAELDMAVVFISQVARRVDMTQAPRRWHLKESGDLENEARLIVMLHREESVVHGLIDKSTVGGEDCRFKMIRDGYGLREYHAGNDDF
jgi:replicative DNA helicase